MDEFEIGERDASHQHANAPWWLFITVVALFAIVIFASWKSELPDAKESKPAWTATANVASSITATGLTVLVVRFLYGRKLRGRRRQFTKLFGKDVLTKPVGIVLPRFDTKRSSELNGAIHVIDKAVKDARLTVRAQLAFDDVVAIRHISAMFAELGLSTPIIMFDHEVRVALFGPSPGEAGEQGAITEIERRAFDQAIIRARQCCAFVVVGLFSNRVTMQFDQSMEPQYRRLFKLTSIDLFRQHKRGILICDEKRPLEWLKTCDDERADREAKPLERNLDSDQHFLPDQEDLVLIAKVVGPGSRPCIIVGGASARGTRKGSKYLLRNWDELLLEKDVERDRKPVADRCFAARYHIAARDGASLERGPIAVFPDYEAIG